MVHFKIRYRKFRHRNVKHPQGATPDEVMCKELKRLVDTVSDSVSKKAFHSEVQPFLTLFKRFAEMTRNQELDWERIRSPAAEKIVPFNQLADTIDPPSLNKLAVLKLNGGHETYMGISGADNALEVKNSMTFLDLAVGQIEHLNVEHNVDIPLILMTSFNTHEVTLRTVNEYSDRRARIMTFKQSRYPRILKESLLPYPKTAADKKGWYPPGHGELYSALTHSGVLDQLLGDGKRYLFVSNSDNLGAVVEPRILQHMINTQAEFLMEVTDKTKADVTGGTLVDHGDSMRLLEFSQVPSEHREEFKSDRKFKTFNTNNLWIDLEALRRIMNKGTMELDIIMNPKVTEDGQSVLQLETAAGAAIKHFKNVLGVNVPRSRFLPVKCCSDLLLVKSDVYSLDKGRLVISDERVFGTAPVIQLGDHFRMIEQFHRRFKQIPKMIDLDHLTVSGDVYFGRNVTLRGTVIIVAHEGQRIDIPDGSLLENRVLTGNLNMIAI